MNVYLYFLNSFGRCCVGGVGEEFFYQIIWKILFLMFIFYGLITFIRLLMVLGSFMVEYNVRKLNKNNLILFKVIFFKFFRLRDFLFFCKLILVFLDLVFIDFFQGNIVLDFRRWNRLFLNYQYEEVSLLVFLGILQFGICLYILVISCIKIIYILFIWFYLEVV